MRKTLILACREYKAAVKTKGFIIGLVLAPIFMGGSLIAFALLKDRVDTKDKAVVIVDRSEVIASPLLLAVEERNQRDVHDKDSGNKIKPAYLLDVVEPNATDPQSQRLALSNRVRRGQLHAYVEIGADVVHPKGGGKAARVTYHAKNAAMDDVRSWLGQPINNELRKLRMADAGIEESQIKGVFDWVNVEGMGLVSRHAGTGKIKDAQRASPIEAILVPIITMMLMFMMVMMNVPGMLHSVMEEKTQRIAEVLLGSIGPFEFMMGKLISCIAVALTTSLVYLVGIVVVVRHMEYQHYIPFQVLPWFLVYMILAIVMMGAIALALGATCSEAKDAQSLTFPTIMPAMICMFVYFPVAKEPLSQFATVMSLIPPCTPMLMLLRQATPEIIPLWQPIMGLVGVLLCTVLVVWLGGRIFRVAILMQGTPPKLGNLVKWAIRG
jgi:ABC-2 type transport system permease protein